MILYLLLDRNGAMAAAFPFRELAEDIAAEYGNRFRVEAYSDADEHHTFDSPTRNGSEWRTETSGNAPSHTLLERFAKSLPVDDVRHAE